MHKSLLRARCIRPVYRQLYRMRFTAAPMSGSARGGSEAEVNVGCGAAASRERN